MLVAAALGAAELAFLNAFCDATRAAEPELWGVGGPMAVDSYAQPLLDFPEVSTALSDCNSTEEKTN